MQKRVVKKESKTTPSWLFEAESDRESTKKNINGRLQKLASKVTEMGTDGSTSYRCKYFIPKHNAQVVPKRRLARF